MVEMLGDDVLPESVSSARRRFRRRVREVRRPIRRRRRDMVPGPDVIGELEQKFSDAKRSAADREGLMDRLNELRASRKSGSDSSVEETSNGESESTSARGRDNQETAEV